MYCSISGLVPTEPVVSRKSGHVFERRLIEKALVATGGKCPETGVPLGSDDLLPVVSGGVARPVPAANVSLPGLLEALQNEWDATIIETHRVKQALAETRQELAHALFQYDAATRVIARLVKERDEARMGVAVTNGVAGDGMDVERGPGGAANGPVENHATRKDSMNGVKDLTTEDNAKANTDAETEVAPAPSTVLGEPAGQESPKVLSNDVMEVISASTAEITNTRKSRTLSETLASSADMEACAENARLALGNSGAALTAILALDNARFAVGAADGAIHCVKIDDLSEMGNAVAVHDKNGGIFSLATHASHGNTLFSGGGDGCVRIWDDSDGLRERVSYAEASPIVDVGVHPCGALLFSCIEEGGWLWRDIESGKELSRFNAKNTSGSEFTSGKVHPDGAIFATGGRNGVIQMWELKTMQVVAELSVDRNADSSGICEMCMSENGYTLAAGIDGKVELWDLRKLKIGKEISVNASGGAVSVALDSSGSYGCGSCVTHSTLFTTRKRGKNIATFDTGSGDGAVRRLGAAWGADARVLLVGGADGVLRRFSSSKM